MPLKFIPTNVKYNDSGEFKNISIPADRAYMDEVITVSSTQPTNSDNKLWINTNEQTKQTYQIPTVSESLALGINNASVGDIICVSEIDSLGKPTSWQHVSLNEIICNKNLLDNWYFVGGGSQLGAGVFPINQRGQATYDLNGTHGSDRWRGTNAKITINSDSINVKLGNGSSARQRFSQITKLSLHSDEKYTFSVLMKVNANTNNALEMWLSSSSFSAIKTYYPNAAVSSFFKLYSWTFTVDSDTSNVVIELITNTTSESVLADIDIKAVKLELGSYQTLAHNEGTESSPNWVLNEIPDYGEELAKCQKYFQIIPASGTFLTPIGHGIGYDTNQIRVTVPLSTPMVKTPTVTVQNCSFRFYQDSLSAAITTYTAVTATSGSSGNEHLRPYVMLRFTVTGALNAKVAEAVITADSGSTNPGILLSAED